MSNNNQSGNVTQSVEQGKKQNTSCLWITIIFLIIALCMLLILSAGGVFWYMHSQSTKTKNASEQSKQDVSQEINNTTNSNVGAQTNKELPIYKNDEFGFALEMLPGWEEYKTKDVMLGGDFNIADVDFYLPSQTIGDNTDMPGYAYMFTISVYVKDSWQEFAEYYAGDITLEDVIGSNDSYIFVYSPSDDFFATDLSKDAIANMDKIVKNIKTYVPNTSAYDDSEFFDDVSMDGADYDSLYGDYFAFNNVYAQNSIEYWNCMYNYQLNYPTAWSNNSPSNISDTVEFYGKNVTTTIRVEDAAGLSTEEFFVKEYKKEFPKAVLDPEGEKLYMPETDTMIYYLAFAAPYERRLYWKVAGSDVGMVMTIKGAGFTDEWDNITNMVGTLKVNTTPRSECAG